VSEEQQAEQAQEQRVPKWGDPLDTIPVERQQELREMAERQRVWAAQPKGERELEQSAFKRVRLNGAEAFFLAALAMAGPAGDLEEAVGKLGAARKDRDLLRRIEMDEDSRKVMTYLEERITYYERGGGHPGAPRLDPARHSPAEDVQDGPRPVPTTLSALHLEGAILSEAHLEDAFLDSATLEGTDLREAHLEGASLVCTVLTRADLSGAQLERANLTSAHLQEAALTDAWLQEAILERAQLQKASLDSAMLWKAQLNWAQVQEADLSFAILREASLIYAHLRKASLYNTYLWKASLRNTYLQETILKRAKLEEADLDGATLDSKTTLAGAFILADGDARPLLARMFRRPRYGPALGDLHWGDFDLVQLTQMEGWEALRRLGDERHLSWRSNAGAHRDAVRAYRQVAQRLRDQGYSDIADRLTDRAQVLQRKLYFRLMLEDWDWRRPWRLLRLPGDLVRWLFSGFLALLAGYGYHPGRSVFWYLATITGFTVLYMQATQGWIPFGLPAPSQLAPLPWYESLILSVSSFHGRGFFQPLESLGDPVAALAAIEAVLGLLIEISFIATFTQRFFGAK